MMRTAQRCVAVVRRADGELVVRETSVGVPSSGPASWPLVRGLAALGNGMRAGQQALRFSAGIFAEEVATGALLSIAWALTTDGSETSAAELPPPKPLWFVLPITGFVLLFIVLPQLTIGVLDWLFGLQLSLTGSTFQLLSGAAILTILLGYVLGIRQVPYVYRVFQYHGAEHKVVRAHEAQLSLNVQSARPMSTLHPRCGTTFIVFVAGMATLAFVGLGALLAQLLPPTATVVEQHLWLMLLKLVALPVVAGVAYEQQRLLARIAGSGSLRFLQLPGYLVQRITTIEPDDHQLDVAVTALRLALSDPDRPGFTPPAQS